MTRVSGVRKSAAIIPPMSPSPAYGGTPSMADLGIGILRVFENQNNASRMRASIGGAERPSNIWYRMNGQSTYWYQYELMNWYRSEVSVLSTITMRAVSELFRYDLELKPKFALRCVDCGHECQTMVKECPVCKKTRLIPPDASQKKYFIRPNGKSFIDDANDSHKSLKDVLKSYAESEYLNNQAYMLCITGDVYNEDTGELERAYPIEFLAYDPRFVRYLYDDTGKPGALYAFTRDDRRALINLNDDRSTEEDFVSTDGKILCPAAWQIGSNYGGTGDFLLYTEEELYQDQWFRPSLIYGTPIWLDIEDDLLAYHFIEKHNLKKYKYGYVRKVLILPGFNDEDAEDIIKGIQDVLATNDNSIPIICTPPQMQGVAQMEAQTLELGTESSQDLLAVKSDIRDRLCAHGGLPNMFAGDVEASGGMNNESQQITIFDRYLMGPYNYIDRLCDWIMSWFPKITDWELAIMRPSKAYTDVKRRMDRIQEAQAMKQLGFDIHYIDGEFWYSDEPIDQVQRREQEQMMQQQMLMQSRGILPGDGYGPPEKGTARREDPDIGETEDEIDQAKREAEDSHEV